jgi:hypothetical protein
MGTGNDITNAPKETDGSIAPAVGTNTNPGSMLFAPKDNLAMGLNLPALGDFMSSYGKGMNFPDQDYDSICGNLRSILAKYDMMSSTNS